MSIDIDNLSEAELRDLNRKIVARLNFLLKMRTHAQMMDFSVGDRVTFHPSGRNPIFGVITKFNTKTITVMTDDGSGWNVAPTLLTKVQDNEGSKNTGNIIELPVK